MLFVSVDDVRVIDGLPHLVHPDRCGPRSLPLQSDGCASHVGRVRLSVLRLPYVACEQLAALPGALFDVEWCEGFGRYRPYVVSLHEVLHHLGAWRGHVSLPQGVSVGAALDDALVSRFCLP